jgi:hypothetical protein
LKRNATFISKGSLVSASPAGNVTCDVWMAGRGSREKTLRKASSYSLE